MTTLHGPAPAESFAATWKPTVCPRGRPVIVVLAVAVGSSLTVVVPPRMWRHRYVFAADGLFDSPWSCDAFALRCTVPVPTITVIPMIALTITPTSTRWNPDASARARPCAGVGAALQMPSQYVQSDWKLPQRMSTCTVRAGINPCAVFVARCAVSRLPICVSKTAGENEDAAPGLVELAVRHIEERLPRYEWPGNVRELRDCVSTLHHGGEFRPLDLGRGTEAGRSSTTTARSSEDPLRSLRLGTLSDDEAAIRYRTHVVALAGNVTDAARRLRLHRNTVTRSLDLSRLNRWRARRPR